MIHKIRNKMLNRALRRLERMGLIDIWLDDNGISAELRR